MKKVLKVLAVFEIALIAYAVAHRLGTAERGYEAVGGEIFIPFLVIFAKDIWEMIKAPFKAVMK
jgi:hypothetical protein